MRKMKSGFRFVSLLTLSAGLVGQFSTLYAQTPSPPTPSPSPRLSETPKYSEQQMREMIGKLQERIGKATGEVMGRIRKEEDNLFLRFSYFRKPDRLNPVTYDSKEEVEQWRQSLQQMREKAEVVDKLYANADLDLGNALIQQRINQSIADQIKKELLQSFPWDVIKKKGQLMKEFIADFGDLLTFYDQNWGSWKADTAGAASFDDPVLASGYQTLKNKLNLAGGQLENQYKLMMGSPPG
jgi:hypothetical protein